MYPCRGRQSFFKLLNVGQLEHSNFRPLDLLQLCGKSLRFEIYLFNHFGLRGGHQKVGMQHIEMGFEVDFREIDGAFRSFNFLFT